VYYLLHIVSTYTSTTKLRYTKKLWFIIEKNWCGGPRLIEHYIGLYYFKSERNHTLKHLKNDSMLSLVYYIKIIIICSNASKKYTFVVTISSKSKNNYIKTILIKTKYFNNNYCYCRNNTLNNCTGRAKEKFNFYY